MNAFGPQTAVKPSPVEVPDTGDGNTSNSQSGNIPNAALGGIVTGVLGRKRVPEANTIWTGNLRPLTETTVATTSNDEVIDLGGGITKIVTTTTTVETVTIIGYLIDIHMAIALGPDGHLVGIYVDNQEIWTGDIGPARTSDTIDENDTFLSGATISFAGGAYDQTPEPHVAGLVADYPGYVGIMTILLRNVRADLPMGNLSFEVVRVPNPLSLSAGVNRDGDDLNVVSAAVEVMTNPWGWGGVDISNFDTTKLSSMATIVDGEGNFCSIKIAGETSCASIIKSLQDQAAAVYFQNSETGLITGNLIRASDIDYVSGDRFYINENLIEINSFMKTGWPDTIEQARGLYTERDAEYNVVPVFLMNTANATQAGRGRKLATVEYPFVPNKTLALTLLGRDLSLLAAPLSSFSMLTDRDGALQEPGNIVLVTHPDFSLLNWPVVIIKVRKQDLKQNNVVLQVRQMKLPDTDTLFGAGGDTYDPQFDVSPATPTAVAFVTAPYFMARARAGISSDQSSPVIFPLILPKPANNIQYSFGALITNVPSTPGDVKFMTDGLYPTFADLNTTISKYDGTTTGIITNITITNVLNGVNLVDVGSGGVSAGQLFLICGNEIMSFESVTDLGGGDYQLNNVHRGLLDTVAEDHAINDDCYIINNNFNNIPSSPFSYPLGYTPSWVITSNTVAFYGKKAGGLVSTGWAPSNVRTLAPPRPHNTKVDATARSSTPVPVTIGVSATVSWVTRNRTSGNVKKQLDAAESPEINGASTQIHRVIAVDSAAAVHDCGTVTGNSLSFNWPSMALGVGYVYVQSEITIGGVLYTSIQQDRIPVTVS